MIHHSIISVVVFVIVGILSFIAWWFTGNIIFNVINVVSLGMAIALYFTLKVIVKDEKHHYRKRY